MIRFYDILYIIICIKSWFGIWSLNFMNQNWICVSLNSEFYKSNSVVGNYDELFILFYFICFMETYSLLKKNIC